MPDCSKPVSTPMDIAEHESLDNSLCRSDALQLDGEPTLRHLPDELMMAAISNLDAVDACRLSGTCRRLCQLVADDSLWEHHHRQRWSHPSMSSRPAAGWRRDYGRRHIKDLRAVTCIENLCSESLRAAAWRELLTLGEEVRAKVPKPSRPPFGPPALVRIALAHEPSMTCTQPPARAARLLGLRVLLAYWAAHRHGMASWPSSTTVIARRRCARRLKRACWLSISPPFSANGDGRCNVPRQLARRQRQSRHQLWKRVRCCWSTSTARHRS